MQNSGYNRLREAGVDRSWRLRIVFGNRYGYPLNLRIDISVEYGDGTRIPICSEIPFEGSGTPSEEWTMFLPERPIALRLETPSWSGTLDVRSLEISRSRYVLVAESFSDADHVKDVEQWISGRSPGFSLSPWSSRSGVRIAFR